MRNPILTTLIIFICFFQQITSQVIYSDNFENNLQIESSANYDVSLENGAVKITGNGNGGDYEVLSYQIHNEGSPIIIDTSPNPQLYFKATATPPAILRIDFADEDGYVSNFGAVSANVNTSSAIYQLNFDRELEDGGYGGSPCTAEDAPCPVDKSRLQRLDFFINPGSGGYNGTIEIEWLSIGESLETQPEDAFDIRYNQVGYLTGTKKYLSIASSQTFASKDFSVLDMEENEILLGNSSEPKLWSASNKYVAHLDVSSIDIAGTYKLQVEDSEIEFSIKENGYPELSNAAFKYYYYNRASNEVTSQYGGEFARASGHPDTNIKIHPSAASPERPTGTVISAPKGWYDAGDYNKYIVNSGISTYTLLAAYEHYTEYYNQKTFDIPEETNDIPDLLDEIKWNLDWMLDMQDPNDGGVYHKLTGLNFSGEIMPADYNFERYVVQKTTAAALNFAAVAAMASRVYANFDTQFPQYSNTLLEAAKSAYQWAKENPTVYYDQPDDVFTGEYGDNDVSDEFVWAATELFITSMEDQYKSDINENSIGGGIPFWGYTAPLALISILHHETSLEGELNVSAITETFLETATELKMQVENGEMKISIKDTEYNWGSNSHVANQILILIRAYDKTNDESYLSAAYTTMDYLLGRNGTGYSFVTGYGTNSPIDPHHRISRADGVSVPVPGMLVGGPHSGQQDNCAGYPNSNPASSYSDTWCSYSTNEVTINWNAPLTYIANALTFYHSGLTTLSVNEQQPTDRVKAIKLYPNPSNDYIQIQNSGQSLSSWEIFSLQGKIIQKSEKNNDSERIDITNLSEGIYFLRIFDRNETTVLRFIKN